MAIQPLLQLTPDEAVLAANEPRHIDPEAAIGEQLRELRQVKNLTLREVAEKMVGPTGSVRVRYWRGLDLVSDVSFDVATCGMRVDSESFK